MQQPIVGYHLDEFGDWVADLQCGHGQHVRHQPPMTNRPWVLTVEGRNQHLGEMLNCKKCDEPAGDLEGIVKGKT
jgi:hypothetical protein